MDIQNKTSKIENSQNYLVIGKMTKHTQHRIVKEQNNSQYRESKKQNYTKIKKLQLKFLNYFKIISQSQRSLVELTGIEPVTPCLQSRCSPK